MNTQKQIFLIVVLFFAFVGSCAGYAVIDLPFRAPNQQTYTTEESITRGALLFANNCRTCHGNQGEGGIGIQLNRPDLHDQDPLKLKANRDLLTRTITCGRAGTLMPAWLNTNGGSINDRQIQHIVDFLTAPADPNLVDANGNESNKGWAEALLFAENLNKAQTALVGGDTLDSIARVHGVGPRELAAFNGRPSDSDSALDAPLPKDTAIKIPPTPQYPQGRTVTIYTSNDTIRKLAEIQHVGAAIIAEANDLPFRIDGKSGQFTLLDTEGQLRFGLFPGEKLALPAGATFLTVVSDTLASVATVHSIDVTTLKTLNKGKVDTLAAADPLPAGLVLALPEIKAYVVKGQTIEDVARVYSNVTADSLAQANGVAANSLMQIGQPLVLPPDTWGTAPGIGTKNPGTACVQYAVPVVVFDQIMGNATPTSAPAVPATVSTDVKIEAHATDWTITADGQAQPINKGVALVAKGAAIPFTSVSGLHTITINGKTDAGGDLKQGTSRTITFAEAGDFKITCTYHPDMLAWIFVK